MKRFWFQVILGICVAAALFGPLLVLPFQSIVYAQAVPTDTPTLNGSSAYITQTYTEPINVRTGPSTVSYPVIGQLPVGATAPALARSPSSEWIEISYPAGPGGVGWIYAANVTLTGSLRVVEPPPLSSQAILPPVEPPPTATPPATATLDPTLEAAFQVQPTVTRLPTFTPPASIATLPTFDNPAPQSGGGYPITKVIIALAVAGGLVFLVSLFVRR